MKLSIITVNLNDAAGLEKTLASVAEQSYGDIELIVIDGGSQDGSLEVLHRYAESVSYRVSEKDNGIYHAMNKGVLRAKGAYCLFLNSGDFLADRDILSRAMEQRSEADILYGDLLFSSEGPDRLHYQSYPDRLSFGYFYHGGYLPHPSTFIKRELFDRAGLYDETNRIASDWDFLLRALCLHHATYQHLPFAISVYDFHGISSRPQNLEIIQAEKDRTLQRHFPMYVADYERTSPLFQKGTSQLVVASRKHRLVRVLRWFLKWIPRIQVFEVRKLAS